MIFFHDFFKVTSAMRKRIYKEEFIDTQAKHVSCTFFRHRRE